MVVAAVIEQVKDPSGIGVIPALVNQLDGGWRRISVGQNS